MLKIEKENLYQIAQIYFDGIEPIEATDFYTSDGPGRVNHTLAFRTSASQERYELVLTVLDDEPGREEVEIDVRKVQMINGVRVIDRAGFLNLSSQELQNFGIIIEH